MSEAQAKRTSLWTVVGFLAVGAIIVAIRLAIG